MSKLTIIQGPPACGKSTFARQQVAGRKDAVIVCKDDIRHMLGDYWQPRREHLVSEFEREMIRRALLQQYDVFSDALNLEADRIRELEGIAAETEAVVEYRSLYVPFREAVRRDARPDRPHHVGEEAIRKVYEKHFAEDYARELATPEPPEQEDCDVVKVVRLLETPDGVIWTPTPADLETVTKLSMLRYPVRKIALFLAVPEREFRRLLAFPETPLAQAYHSGKIQSELAYRDKVRQQAERGEEWAIKIIERWGMEQTKQELGF